MKFCTKCETNKKKEEFYKNKATEDGLQSWCKICVRASQNEGRKRNPQKYRNWSKKFYYKNIEKSRENSRKSALKWHRNNPEKSKELARLNYRKNSEKRKDYRLKNANIIKARRELYYNKHPEKLKEHRLNIKLDKYGISKEQYQKMLEDQNFSCAICKKSQSESKKSLSIDHCHKTGKVRGLLCYGCNTGIGHLKDDVSIVSIALEYLKKFK